jgi:phosphoribosylamine--glycine ligase
LRVLIVGGGGREHALAWKIGQSDRLTKLYAAPGNGGIAAIAECVEVGADDIEGLVRFAADKEIDFCVVGPEAPLIEGLVDRLDEERVAAFGPNREGAQLEGSKVFAKEFMVRHGIPTAAFRTFSDRASAVGHLTERERGARFPVVVKADGPALAKGAFVCRTASEADHAVQDMMVAKVLGRAGDRIVIEDCLSGREVSYIAFVDGRRIVTMQPSQDHKRAFDGDGGPNTGGMGAFSPVPWLTPEQVAAAEHDVLQRTVAGLISDGIDYRGILYAGLMVNSDGVFVLEYNCRFGDPETQAVLPLMDGDLLETTLLCSRGELDSAQVGWLDKKALCVVLASGGYPAMYEKGYPIEGLESLPDKQVHVFHAGTSWRGGRLVTNGGRVLGVTGVDSTFDGALRLAYAAVNKIRFPRRHFRRDIGKDAIADLPSEASQPPGEPAR